ncbi:TBC1D5_3 [Blepharisma stoltei]|uniref:Rab-GAP TBC domain-containing protein n=1 Tax=Blepharisma stoltei TaxID=1481888 RepID=A0AAU9IRR9_9CILI|nr:unnamed protein product [Blepharisma stoltei]
MESWYSSASIEEVRRMALSGHLRHRFIAWQVMLGIFYGSVDNWVLITHKHRLDYNRKKAELIPKKILGQDIILDNPLSNNAQSPWYTHFKNQEIRRIIRIDVDRTFQKYQFFQQERNKAYLENTLFVWSMTHTLGYNQGFNELMAVILYAGLSDEETPDNLISHENIEADCYTIFSKLMDTGIANMFIQKLSRPKLRDNALDEIATVDRSSENDLSEMIRRCHYVFHRVLQATDPELYHHILKYKYEPQLFLVRWLRCMLSREFSLNQTLIVWDTIFACHDLKSRDFELLNYICAAMLSSDRECLLSKRDSDLLQELMNPVPIEDIKGILQIAMRYLREKPDNKVSYTPHQGSNIFTSSLKMLYDLVTTRIGPPIAPVVKITEIPKNEKEITLESMLKITKQVKAMIKKQKTEKEIDENEIRKAIRLLKIMLDYNED